MSFDQQPFQSEDQQFAQCFNRGSDARIAGQPKPTPDKFELFGYYSSFIRGWNHVDKFWGIDSKKPVKKLARIKT